MSRVINTSLATIQFQVNARQANAAMQALQEASNDLNRAIDNVNRNIANLGKDVPKDNPQLLNYQNQLAGLKKDLKDVEKAQRDFLKGAKAADQLWKAASEGTIESLSFRSIKAGINGLKKRQEGLSPGDAQDMKDWRIIKEVIDEADRVMKQAGADVQNVVQTIREGGKVSEQTMRQTISTLKELKGSVDETDAEYRTYGNDLGFMEAKLQEFNEAQRRARGEIVDANDARREMNKLTEEGAAAAKREAEEADRLVQQYKAEGEELVKKRNEIKANIEDAQKQIDENHKLIEEKHRQLAADEETFNAEQQSRRESIDGLKQQAEAERKLANEKSDAAETHRRAADLQKQTTEQLTEKVTELQGKLAELNAEPVKPKVDTSEIDALNEKLRLAEELLQQKTTAANTAFNNYVSAQGLTPISKRDNVAFRENFEKMYGLAGYMDISHMDAKHNLRFPLDMRLDQVKDAAGAREEDWEVSKEQAQKILDDYNWFVEKIDKVAEAIAAQYKKLSQASSEGVDPEQLKTVAANIKRLEDLRAQFLKTSEDMAMDGVNRPQEMFGDVDKTIDNVGRNVDRAIKKAIDERYEFHEKKHAVEIQEAKEASELADKEKEAAQIAVDGIKAEIEAKKQNVGAIKNEAEAVKELIKMRERINELHQKKDSMSGIMPTVGIDKELNELMPKYEAGMKGLSEESRKLVREFTEAKRDLADIIRDEKEADEALKQFGITTADVADDLKLQAAAEKALKIEEESRLELAKQMLEVRKQIGAESLKDSRIVGSKKEQDFYKKNKDILDNEYWKGEAGGGSVGRMYKYLNDIADDSEARAEFQEQVGVSVKDAMRVAAQRMREVLQEAMKRGIKVDDALSSFEDGYGQGPATHIHEFFKEFNEAIDEKEEELIRKRRRKLDAILDVVEDPGDEAEMPSREERLKLAKSALKGVGEGHYGNDTPLAESRRQQEEEVTRLDAKVKEFINTQEKSNQQTEEELRLKGELETAQGKLAESKQRENEEQQEYVKLQGEAIEQGNKAAAAETKLADAQSDATQKQVEFNQKQQEGLDNINQMAEGNQALQQSIDGLNGELEQNSKDSADNANKVTEAEQKKQQARQLSIQRMEEMLAKLQKEYREEELTAEKRKEHIKQIQELERAISTEKAKPALQMMTDRMGDLGKLSASALEETRRFWDAMVQGAEKGSEKLAAAEANVKALVEEERKRSEAQAGMVIGNMGSYSDKEIADAVKSFEQLRDAQTHGNDEWRKFNELAEQGKQHLEELAKADALAKMEERMNNLTNLSDTALAETKKYWEALKAGAEKGSEDLAKAETNLTRIIDLEKERTRIENERKAQIVSGGKLNMYSEAEISEAIKAAKELHSHMASADPEARKLADSIAKAEAHIKQYGIEAARAAQRQEELDATMHKQFQTMMDGMRSGVMPSQDAVKSQMNYWKKLIDDPKTAAESLQFYRDQLAEVKKMYDFMIKSQGESALTWFQQDSDKDASGNQIKEMADKLKEYRGTLLKETNADEIAQIDAILQRIGASAKKAAEDMMPLRNAFKIGLQGLNGTFKGSSKDLAAAKKSIEDALAGAEKGSRRYNQLQRALNGVELEMRRIKELTPEVQAVLDKPKGRSFNDLKQAIEQARQKLNSIDRTTEQGQAEFKKLAEQIKNADYEMRQLGNSSKGTANAFEKAWSRFKTYVTFYVSAAAAIQKVIATFGDLMELSDKMGEVRKTTGFTADEVGRLSDSLKKLDTRTTLTGLMDLSVAAGQLGLKTEEDVLGFTEAANKLMVALPEMGKEGATEMLKVALATGEIAKIEKQMQEGLIDGSSATAVAMEKVGSTIDRLRATSAATAPAITDFVKRVGAVGAQSGISIDQVAALGSTVDALGMRVEMSATALSRMIPAIKNNAYQIGAMIGQTEESIIQRFEHGMGMDVILDIFQSIRDNSKMMTGDVEADAESIEQAFEGAGLKEVMKELNQMGARAGIVFAGLSQNVDELRRQLGVAAEAYEENIAITNEYNKLNETAAAKWERLKNEIEEYFVSDSSQRFLGGVIDFLRKIVDLFLGEGGISGGIQTIIILISLLRIKVASLLVGAVKGLLNVIKTMNIISKFSWTGFFNVITAIGGAVWYAGSQFGWWGKELGKADKAIHRTNQEISEAITKFERMYDRLKKSKEAMEAARISSDNLSGSAEELAKAHDKAERAAEGHRKIVDLMNQQYGAYLGFMLTEYDRAELIAAAHDKITASIKREMYAKQKQAAVDKINSEYSDDMVEQWGQFTQAMRDAGATAAEVAKASNAAMAAMSDVKFDAINNKFIYSGDVKDRLGSLASGSPDAALAIYMNRWMSQNTRLTPEQIANITGVRLGNAESGWEAYRDNNGHAPTGYSEYNWLDKTLRGNLFSTFKNKAEQISIAENYYETGETKAANDEREASEKVLKDLQQRITNDVKTINGEYDAQLVDYLEGYIRSLERKLDVARQNGAENVAELERRLEEKKNLLEESKSPSEDKKEEAYKNLANSLLGLDELLKNLDNQKDTDFINEINTFVEGIKNRVNNSKLGTAIEEARKLFQQKTNKSATATIVGDGNGNGGPRGLYGNYDKRVAPYEEWDANALVKRREEMLIRVRALANGADVQAVLSMDKRFMDEATRKGIKDMRDAIEWYNTERMKIQEELHERHLTNEGQWMDPKQSRSKKPKQVYSEEAIAELDRYYAWRKEELERQRAEEGVSEAEFNRRMETIEQEHLQKRADLRRSFTTEDKKFVEQFRKWWKGVAELDHIEWELIEAEWIAALDRDRKYNDRNAQKDLAAMRAITVKQLKAIEDIIAKERPFNGITDNLETNLTKMGVLFADFDKMRRDALERGATKDETDAINAQSDAERTKRLSWLLGMSEEAYTLTIEELMRRMAKDGMQAWADELNANENGEAMKRALLAQLHVTYDAVQDAIKKESSQIKKQADIMWNDVASPGSSSMKQAYESAISALGLQKDSVSRANSLIGAGVASERVADRLAIKQLQIRLAMQEHYYRLVRQKGAEHIAKLEAEAAIMEKEGKLEEARIKRLDVEHAKTALNLSLSEEQKKLDEQRVAIANQLEESQNRLYTALKEWADLLSSSVREVFEASHAGEEDYYNSLAMYNLTGKGGPGAGTYVVTENAGREGATAHYEYLSEREAIERQREIERQNAQAEAWKKVFDDINQKLNETITDQLNAMLQNASIDANTDAVLANTDALVGLTGAMTSNAITSAANGNGSDRLSGVTSGNNALSQGEAQEFAEGMGDNPSLFWAEMSDVTTAHMLENQKEVVEGQKKSDQQMQKSTQSMYAKMTAAANLYGVAYQTMSNDNLSAAQKFEMFALQAAGQAAIAMLTTDLATEEGKTAVRLPGILGKLLGEMPYPAAMATFAIVSALIGGLMGLAVSKIGKSKSQISQATGASGASAGKLTTGMLTYAEGNVNEFTDPATLTVGKQYNVDGRDGRTYRARYMGKGAKTHITNGPEFHLVGEAGREAIIDAKTTRLIRMNDTGIWQDIQTLYRGGSLADVMPRRRRGIRAFASGNLEDFEESYGSDGSNETTDLASIQASLDRNSAVQEALLERLNQPIYARNILHGADGLPNVLAKLEKEAKRHGVKYI